jgi:RNA polymerase sigma-70 factor (ECF subfamily)
VFPATSWSCVLAAKGGDERARHLDRLFRAYWGPVFGYIRRAWHRSEEDARDLTQQFFLRLLETDFLRDVSPSKGRFRSYIKACLRHFLMDEKKFAAAQKRGGDAKLFSIDAAERPVEIPAPTPEESFDLEWTHALLTAALRELEGVLKAAGREATFEVFRRLDIEAGERPGYADVARALGMAEQAVKSQADYARKTLRKIILERIRDYTADDAEARAELKELFPA